MRITVPPRNGKPVARYLEAQGRFQHLTAEEVVTIQAAVDAAWAALLTKTNPSGDGSEKASNREASPGPEGC